jgi:porin
VNDPPLFIAEFAYAYNQPGSIAQENPHQEGARPRTSQQPVTVPAAIGGLPGTVKLGAWLHTGRFADERFDIEGGLLAASGGPPLQHSGNFAVYGMIDQMLWRAAGGGSERELSIFLRALGAPDDRNLIDFYLDTGLTYKGLVASRPDDTIGLGAAYSRVSPLAAANDRDVMAITGMATPIRDYEATIELTYQMQLEKNWSIQPNLQYIVHPGGHVPNPRDPSGAAAITNALVVGARTILKF